MDNSRKKRSTGNSEVFTNQLVETVNVITLISNHRRKTIYQVF